MGKSRGLSLQTHRFETETLKTLVLDLPAALRVVQSTTARKGATREAPRHPNVQEHSACCKSWFQPRSPAAAPRHLEGSGCTPGHRCCSRSYLPNLQHIWTASETAQCSRNSPMFPARLSCERAGSAAPPAASAALGPHHAQLVGIKAEPHLETIKATSHRGEAKLTGHNTAAVLAPVPVPGPFGFSPSAGGQRRRNGR